MKKVGLISCVIAVAGLALCVFAGSALSQTKPIELKLASWDPPQSLPAQLTQKMVDRINEKGVGKVKVTPYFGETLLKQQEHFRSTQLGVADMAYFGPTAPGSPVVLGRIISLPFLGVSTTEMATAVYSKLINESPDLKAEYKGLKIVGIFCLPFDNLHMKKKAVHVPADTKGSKIIALGPRVDFMKAAGAVPVTIGLGDWYTSVDRGLVEGLYFLTNALAIFKGEDLFKYHTIVNGSTGANFIIFNEQKWKSLPADVQAVIEEAGRYFSSETLKQNHAEEDRVVGLLKQKGHEIYTPTADEMKIWHATAKTVHDKWIADTEAKGLPAKKVYDQLQTIIKGYK